MKKLLLLLLFCLLTGKNFSQTITDADGNTYNTVTIGTQVWMKENLKTTKYNDGTTIPYHTGPDGWLTLTTPAYCWNNNNLSYKATYGALYNWFAVNTGKLCPVNWRVPTQEDFNTLITGQGGTDLAGGYLDPVNFIPNFHTPGIDAYFWSGSEKENKPWCIDLNVYSLKVSLSNNYEKQYGMSVRCIKVLNSAVLNPLLPKEKLIYPNPATDKLYINQHRFNHPVIIIFDLQGKEIVKQTLISGYIDISKLPKGAYLVRITDSKSSATERLIKQ